MCYSIHGILYLTHFLYLFQQCERCPAELRIAQLLDTHSDFEVILTDRNTDVCASQQKIYGNGKIIRYLNQGIIASLMGPGLILLLC